MGWLKKAALSALLAGSTLSISQGAPLQPSDTDFSIPREAWRVHGVIGATYYEEPLELNCTITSAKIPNPPSRDMVHHAIRLFSGVKSAADLRVAIQREVERMEGDEFSRRYGYGSWVLASSALENVEAVWSACRKSQSSAMERLNGPEVPVSDR